MSTARSTAPPGAATQEKKTPTFLERLANALVYVIVFPFIASFIAIKRIFTERKKPAHSYYDRLPEQHLIGQQNGQATGKGVATAGDG
jgi:hypothetical protein